MYFGDSGSYKNLSFFHRCQIKESGVVYPSVYHYYLCHKFDQKDYEKTASIMRADTIRKLVVLSNSRHKLSAGWDLKKYDIMRKGYELKIQQHPEFRQYLINLRCSELKYNSQPSFKFWCVGNMLGKLLMELKRHYSDNNKHIFAKEDVGDCLVRSNNEDYISTKPTKNNSWLKNVAPVKDSTAEIDLFFDDNIQCDNIIWKKTEPSNEKTLQKKDNSWLKNVSAKKKVLEQSHNATTNSGEDIKDVIERVIEETIKDVIEDAIEDVVEQTNKEPSKPLLVISLNPNSIKVEESICIPIVEKKMLTGEEVSDELLIKIATILSKMHHSRRICIADTTGWYSNILYELMNVILGKPVDESTEHGKYASSLLSRKPI
jgi:predicted NAD-dependent protein-ADP-ribosyltransferase YbiA (DUF1768 family)